MNGTSTSTNDARTDTLIAQSLQVPDESPVIAEGVGWRHWRNPVNRFNVFWLHYTADPAKRSEEWAAETKATQASAAKFEQEYNINFRAMGGEKAFPQVSSDRDVIVLQPPYPLDDAYVRYFAGLDYGIRNPSSFGVYGQTRNDQGNACYDKLYEFYKPVESLTELANAILECPFYDKLAWIACDPSMKQRRGADASGVLTSIMLQLHQLGVSKLVPALSNREEQFLTLMREYWSRLEDRGPLFRIRVSCHATIREFETATFAELGARQALVHNPKEKLVDRNNHAIDEAKYALLTAEPLSAGIERPDSTAYPVRGRRPIYLRHLR